MTLNTTKDAPEDRDIAFVERAIRDYESNPADPQFVALARQYHRILARLRRTTPDGGLTP